MIGGAIATIQWYGTSTYFVAFDGDEVVIYQGRPDGILWIEPELVERTGIDRADVPDAVRAAHRGRQRAADPGQGPAARRQHRGRTSTTTGGRAGTTTTTTSDQHDQHHRGHDHHPGQLMLRAVRRNTELGPDPARHPRHRRRLRARLPGRGRHHPGQHRRRSSAIVLGLQLAAHLAVRRLAPDADGMLLPIAGLLNGLGYVFIARLDEAKADPKTWPACRRRGSPSASPPSSRTLLVVRRVRDLERYRWTFGLLGIALLLLPLVPGHRPRVLRRPHLGEHRADQLPARRVRQDPAGHLLRRRTSSRSASCSP